MTVDEAIQSLPEGEARDTVRAEYERLRAVFLRAAEHLDYCGYGDGWERECAADSGLVAEVTALAAELKVSK